MKKILLAVAVFAIHFHSAYSQLVNADSAFTLARQSHRDILLVFLGSDWCAPCMRFEKKVLNDPSFIQFSNGSLIVVQADFPQSKKLSLETIKQNEELARKFNPSGSFPLIVLLDSNQNVQAYFEYHNENSSDFISLLNHYLQ